MRRTASARRAVPCGRDRDPRSSRSFGRSRRTRSAPLRRARGLRAPAPLRESSRSRSSPCSPARSRTAARSRSPAATRTSAAPTRTRSRVLELAFHHLAELDFAVGVIPFVGALLAAYALVRFGFPRRALVFGAVAPPRPSGCCSRSPSTPRPSTPRRPRIRRSWRRPAPDPRALPHLPRAALPRRARRGASRREASRARPGILGAALVAALLPAADPVRDVINATAVADTFGLQVFATVAHGALTAVSHATLVAVSPRASWRSSLSTRSCARARRSRSCSRCSRSSSSRASYGSG